MTLIPSHSLRPPQQSAKNPPTSQSHPLPHPFISPLPPAPPPPTPRKKTYSTTVAVPTNISRASSPPAPPGWNFVSLAAGRASGTAAPAGRSLVAGRASPGSRVRCFMVRVVPFWSRGVMGRGYVTLIVERGVGLRDVLWSKVCGHGSEDR